MPVRAADFNQAHSSNGPVQVTASKRAGQSASKWDQWRRLKPKLRLNLNLNLRLGLKAFSAHTWTTAPANLKAAQCNGGGNLPIGSVHFSLSSGDGQCFSKLAGQLAEEAAPVSHSPRQVGRSGLLERSLAGWLVGSRCLFASNTHSLHLSPLAKESFIR